jgi:hypothetical protein
MSKHLPVLISMFPGKMMLGVDELASLLEYSKGHIYNLASAKKLPFKVATDIGDRLLVSIVELADYLDSKLLTLPPGSQSPPEAVPASPVRKVGRPRGSTRAALQAQCFQADLRAAIIEIEYAAVVSQVQEFAKNIKFSPSEELSPEKQVLEIKSALQNCIAKEQSRLAMVKIDLTLGMM